MSTAFTVSREPMLRPDGVETVIALRPNMASGLVFWVTADQARQLAVDLVGECEGIAPAPGKPFLSRLWDAVWAQPGTRRIP